MFSLAISLFLSSVFSRDLLLSLTISISSSPNLHHCLHLYSYPHLHQSGVYVRIAWSRLQSQQVSKSTSRRDAQHVDDHVMRMPLTINRNALGETHYAESLKKALDSLVVEQRHGNCWFLLEDHFSSLRIVEVVKELGLVTCGRSVFCQGARLLGWRRRRGYLPWRCPHGRRSPGQSTGKIGKRRGRWRRDTRRESERRSNEEQTLNRSSWMAWILGDARMQTLDPCNKYAQN